MKVRQGDVWLTTLDPTIGSEIQKTRPCVVVSPDRINHHQTFVIVPLTSKSHRTRFRPPVTFKGTEGLALADQVRTVSDLRMKRWLGRLDDEDVSAVLKVLRFMFSD